jgi:hypothetical protein
MTTRKSFASKTKVKPPARLSLEEKKTKSKAKKSARRRSRETREEEAEEND